jgi:hypothetical protein
MVKALFNILMLPFMLVLLVLALVVVVICDSLAVVGVMDRIDWNDL